MTALVFPITVSGLSLIFMAANRDIIIVSFKKDVMFNISRGAREKEKNGVPNGNQSMPERY